MIKSAEELTNCITFAKKREGYDTQQVDRYIKLLSDEYNSVCKKYENLLERYSKSEEQSTHIKAHTKAITRTLVDAEVMASRIIAKAEAEAEKIKADAYIQKVAAGRSIERSNEFLMQTITKLQDMVTS